MKRKLFLILILSYLTSLTLSAAVLLPYGSTFSYLKGKDAASLPSSWFQDSYSVDTWSLASAPFWYGDGESGVGTEMSDIRNSYTTIYLRSSFEVEDLSRIDQLNFGVDYDDGFALYVNGQEVLAKNAPDLRNYNATAPLNHESGSVERISLAPDDCHITTGKNTLAVHVFNISTTSSDVYFDVEISADLIRPSLPDSLCVHFSDSSGFYSDPFQVELRSPFTEYQTINYTLDGSNPDNSSSALSAISPVQVIINPASTTGRGLTPGVVLRASIDGDTLAASHIATQTYLFVDKVKTQVDDPGGDWPQGNVNDQELYFGVNDAIASDARYKNEIDNALKAIPSLSIVTDNANLFDASTGIYVNALSDGEAWERPCSFEMINANGEEGFHVDAGLRIRGGWSRHGNFEKHSFRLFFRKEYGAGKLKYPLFGDEGVDQFDKIDLRTAQNYAWYRGSTNNTMVREVFSRDLQGDMGQPYTRSRYYHLYLNGLYYGLYQSQERSEACYAEAYLGGDKEDYDVIKVDRDYDNSVVSISVTDGDDDSWQSIWDRMLNTSMSDALYYSLIGCDSEGNVDPSLACMVDVDNLIDYMIGVFYSGNFDSPMSKFGKNVKPNNFYAIYDRTNPLKGYQFMQHDAEHSLFAAAHSPGIGLYEDRVNVHTLTDDYKYNVTTYDYFTPQWIHIRFLESAEYRVRFADRVYNYLSDGGLLSETANTDRLNRRVNELSSAIIGESLRWGGDNASNKLTKDDHWLPEVNKILNDFFPKRNAIFVSQLKKSAIYPSVDYPLFSIANQPITTASYQLQDRVNLLVTPASGSTLVYTLNGSDPRLSGGDIASAAQTSTAAVSLSIHETTKLIARSYKAGQWSAPHTLYLNSATANLEYLKITELHYNPLDSMGTNDTLSSSKYEFVELKNIHPSKSINLGGLKFTDGISYDFPENYILGPQQFYVIASNAYKFYLRYGKLPSGDYQKHLSNGGENVRLVQANGSTIFEFRYDDTKPWIEDADGTGVSMISYETNPISYSPDLTVYWWASADLGGSPFSDDVASQQTALNVKTMPTETIPTLALFPNPTRDRVQVLVRGAAFDELLGLSFYTLEGRLVYQSKCVNNHSVALPSAHFSAGVYVVKVQMNEALMIERLVYQP